MTINVHGSIVCTKFFFRKNNIRIEFVRCLVGCWAIDYFHSKWQLRQFQHFVHLLSLKQHLFSSQLEISRALNGQTAENQHISRGSIFKLEKKNIAVYKPTLLLNEGIPRALKGKKLRLKNILLFPLIFEEINYF